MNPVCVAVYDIKAQTFLAPVFYADLATAERAFCGLVSDASTTPGQWPDDFSLYHLGAVNPGTGELVSLDHPALIITGQSALIAVSRLRRGGSELSRGVTPSEDKAAVRPDAPDVGGHSSVVSSDSGSGSVQAPYTPGTVTSLPNERK